MRQPPRLERDGRVERRGRAAARVGARGALRPADPLARPRSFFLLFFATRLLLFLRVRLPKFLAVENPNFGSDAIEKSSVVAIELDHHGNAPRAKASPEVGGESCVNGEGGF